MSLLKIDTVQQNENELGLNDTDKEIQEEDPMQFPGSRPKELLINMSLLPEVVDEIEVADEVE